MARHAQYYYLFMGRMAETFVPPGPIASQALLRISTRPQRAWGQGYPPNKTT